MKIVILAGGTGSISLQQGLYNYLDKKIDGIDTKILVNAYDNGKSTGDVRKVLGGQILGPSDVRKNQTTRLLLEQPHSPWNKFLDIRFTCESSKAYEFCLKQTEDLKTKLQQYATVDNYTNRIPNPPAWQLVTEAIDEYFKSPFAKTIDYNDFSLANIVYAGFAKANGNSLREAARIMAQIMGIKDNVIINDDASMFLGAITSSGINVTDEGDIVSWGDVDDPFVDIFFTDPAGNPTKPVLCKEAINALLEANLIILSSGTQWSSLIPTYESIGFKETISKCTAKILMIMNRQPDKDSPGQTADNIIDILVSRYFGENKLHVIIDKTGHPNMSSLNVESTCRVASVNEFSLAFSNENIGTSKEKHSPHELAHAVAHTYFKDYANSGHFMFDYDDTLVGRGNKFPKSSALNRSLLIYLKNKTNVYVCTGNGIKNISLQQNSDLHNETPLTVFADGGINMYEYDINKSYKDDAARAKLISCIQPENIIEGGNTLRISKIISSLKQYGIPLSKIENRGNAVISIKPIDEDYRPAILSLVNMIISNTGLKAKAAGRTTIDISYPSTSKTGAVSYILNQDNQDITFVGDEFCGGNDEPVLQMNNTRIKCLHVKDPSETAFFLQFLYEKFEGTIQI